MKYASALLVALLVGCGPAPQYVAPAPQYVAPAQTQPVEEVAEKPPGCEIQTSSKLETEHVVSDILNLEKDIDPNGRCTVKFDLIVDGVTHHLEETETGWEQTASLCYYARERARENLLLDIGGKFKSESKIDCRYKDQS